MGTMSEVQHWQIDDISIIEDQNFLTESQKKFLDNFVCASDSSNYHKQITFKMQDKMMIKSTGEIEPVVSLFYHVENHGHGKGDHQYYDQFEDILDAFCTKHNINFASIISCRVNLLFHYDNESVEHPIHKDHYDIPHKNLIIYLNDANDKNTYTSIFDENQKMIHTSKPDQYKGLYFSGKNDAPVYHNVVPPKFGHRMTLIYTFV
jgi:hypothetical protein